MYRGKTVQRALGTRQGKQRLMKKNIHVRNLEDEVVEVGQDLIIEDLESLEMKAQSFSSWHGKGVKDL